LYKDKEQRKENLDVSKTMLQLLTERTYSIRLSRRERK
jgi:hypothetical protein